jgi:hypothetical protein
LRERGVLLNLSLNLITVTYLFGSGSSGLWSGKRFTAAGLPVNPGNPGICPLSPLMSALYLKPLDLAMENSSLFYARFMDDWVVLAPTRWKLRRAIKRANQVLAQLILKKHPAKTFIGRIAHGFAFLGYYFTPQAANGLEVANKTIENHMTNITRLYEQGADTERIGKYICHWWRWLNGGVTLKSLHHTFPLPVFFYQWLLLSSINRFLIHPP